MEDRVDYYIFNKQIKLFLNSLKQKKILQIYLEQAGNDFYLSLIYNYVDKQYYMHYTEKEEKILRNIFEQIKESNELKQKYKEKSAEYIVNNYFNNYENFNKYIKKVKIKKQDGYEIEDILKKNRLNDMIGPTNTLDGYRYNISTSYLGEKRTYSFQTYIEKGYEELGKIIEIAFEYLPKGQKEYGKKYIEYKM